VGLVTTVRRAVSSGVPLLTASLVAGGLALDRFALHLHPTPGLFGVSAVIFLLAYGVTEALVLHLEVGQNAHSITLSEVTLVMSLYFLPAAAIAPTRVLAGAVVLYAFRHQRRQKLLFNVSVWVLDVPIALLVFRALDGGLHASYGAAVSASLGSALAAAAVDSLAVNAVIAVSSRQVSLSRTLGFLKACLAGAAASSVLTVLCVAAVAWSRWAAIPMAVALLLAVLALNRFGLLRQQHTNMKVLYAFTPDLGRASSSEHVLATVVSRVGGLLRADHVQLVVDGGDPAQLESTSIAEDGSLTTTLIPVASPLAGLLLPVLSGETAVAISTSAKDASHRELLAHLGLRDAVLATLGSDQGLRGLLVVGDRTGEHTSFTADDGLLLQTLATHASAALANSKLVERLNYESLHDSLTGLANRACFQQQLAAALQDEGAQHAVLLIDLDRFKEVNDTLGHHHGDLLLCEIAARLQTCVRDVDSLARLGGDEFAILLRDVDERAATFIAERMIRAMLEPLRLQGVTMEITGSCGLVLAPQHGTDDEVLLQRADVAMYLAKQNLTGVELYQAHHDDYSPRRLALASNLRAAIEGGELSLRYQPQARSSDGTIIGVEALVRWEHPEYGEVQPDEFVVIAEQTGQIRELTRYVLDAAVRDCIDWQRGGHDLHVSVNISVRNLLESDLSSTVAQCLVSHGLASSKLTLEITETHLMADPARTQQTLRSLDCLGVHLSVDDFGTGYSSLAYLKQLPVREVKVDKGFVRELGSNDDDVAIVEAIIQLAHTLGLEVVAEGVEDAAAKDRLAALGCDTMQGYHLARPMTDRALRAWLVHTGRPVAQVQAASARRLPTRPRRLAAVPVPCASGTSPFPLTD